MKLSPTEIHSEIERVRQNNFRQFVKKVRLQKVRGLINETIELKYPVTALVGTNGGGKSTILGAIAIAYKNIKPGQFFPKAFLGDESMSDWTIELELIAKQIAQDRTVTRTARFSKSKWRRDDFPERPVQYIEIQRTVPAGELTRFRRFLSGNLDDYNVSSFWSRRGFRD